MRVMITIEWLSLLSFATRNQPVSTLLIDNRRTAGFLILDADEQENTSKLPGCDRKSGIISGVLQLRQSSLSDFFSYIFFIF